MVIETASYELKIVGEPYWELSPEEEKLIAVEIMEIVFVETSISPKKPTT